MLDGLPFRGSPERCDSWFASCSTFRDRPLNRSYIRSPFKQRVRAKRPIRRARQPSVTATNMMQLGQASRHAYEACPRGLRVGVAPFGARRFRTFATRSATPTSRRANEEGSGTAEVTEIVSPTSLGMPSGAQFNPPSRENDSRVGYAVFAAARTGYGLTT
jgi:hypothetical protein